MASDAVETAFRDRIAAHIAANASAWDGALLPEPNEVAQVERAATPHVIVQFPIAGADRMNVGPAPVYRETGVARVVVNLPSGQPLGPWRRAIDALRVVLTDVQFGAAAKITTYTAQPPLFDDDNRAGMFWTYAFSVEFYADTIGAPAAL